MSATPAWRQPSEAEWDRFDRGAAAVALRSLAEERGLRFAIDMAPGDAGSPVREWHLEATDDRGERWIVRDRRLYDAACELLERLEAAG